MKKLLSLTVVLLMLLTLAIPAMAQNEQYVVDEMGEVDAAALQELSQRAIQLSEQFGVDLLSVNTYEEDLWNYAESLNLGKYEDKVIYVTNHTSSDIVLLGNANLLFDFDDWTAIYDSCTEMDDFAENAASYYDCMEQIMPNAVSDVDYQTDYAEGDRVVDQADLLSPDEEEALRKKLNEISMRQKMDVVVVTAVSLEGKTAQAYADDFYDFNNYGYGSDYDGVLLMVCLTTRDYWVSTCGYGIDVFTDAGLDHLNEQYVGYLSDGDYAKAFDVFAEGCDDYITQARNGTPYDWDTLPKEPFPLFKNAIVCVVIGFVIAFIVMAVLKGQLKSVRSQSGASDYAQRGSMNVTQRQDLFLYRKVDRRAKPKDTGSSGSRGGSSTHRSSSGRSHGGGGGKF